jgi:co-chaperonin GroES (HSP10)
MRDIMNVQPLHSKVIVAENYIESKSESGIILDGVDSLRQTPHATVLAIGPEVTDVAVGDVVMLEWNKATIITVDGAQRAVIDQSNIMMVVE